MVMRRFETYTTFLSYLPFIQMFLVNLFKSNSCTAAASKKTRVGEVPATSHGFINSYLGVYQSLKVPVQITSNIHGLGPFICTNHSISSLSNVISHGAFKSTGMLYPNFFIF